MPLHLTRQLKRAFQDDPRNCILFVGAGLSVTGVRKNGKGLPTWKQLIQDMIEDLKDSEKCDEITLQKIGDQFQRNEYLKIAQIFREKTRPDQYAAFLKEQLDPNDLTTSKVHELILSIDFKGIITTNFDCVFENQSNRLQPLIYPQGFEDISAFRRHGFFAKIHGCIRNTANPSENLILSEESFLSLRSSPKYQTILKSLFLLHPLLTVGFSLTDPDFLGLVDDLKEIFNESMPTIYSLMLTDDETLRAEWRSRGVEIIPYKEHTELIPFFSELKHLTNTNGTIQELIPSEKEAEIDYNKYLYLWRHSQSKEDLYTITKKQLDKFKNVKEKEAFIFQLLTILNTDDTYLLAPTLVELNTSAAERVLGSLFKKLEIEEKWWKVEPSKTFIPVHSWLLNHWYDISKYEYGYTRVEFIDCFKWLLNPLWTNFGIDLWQTFNRILDEILLRKIQLTLDKLYEASEEVKGAAQSIEQIVFKDDFVIFEDESTRERPWNNKYIRTQNNINFLKFKRKVTDEGFKKYKEHLDEALKANEYEYSDLILKRIVQEYAHHTHLTLHSSSGAYDPQEAKEILETLALVKSKDYQLKVLWAIDRFPEKNRGDMSMGEDNKNIREGLFYPLWWRYSNETRVEYLNSGHKRKMHSITWDTGHDFLLNRFLGLSYDIDKDFVTEFNSSLEKHKSKERYERYEPRPLQELWRYRELKYVLSEETPPEVIRRIAVYRVDWDNMKESDVRWKEAKLKAHKHIQNSTIKKYFSKSDKNYVLDNLLGCYSPSTFTVTLFPQIISQVADDLKVDVDALGTIAFIHLTIHAYCHGAKDLNGRDWLDFSLPQPEQPIFKLSKLHETIAQFYTFKLIDYLQDEKLKRAFLELEKHSEDTYRDWRKVENYTLEDMRTVLIKYRKMTTDFPDLTT
jgi:hypothetical protein